MATWTFWQISETNDGPTCWRFSSQETEAEPIEAAGAADDVVEDSFLLDDGQLTFYGKDPYIANADRLNVESELYFIPSVLPGKWLLWMSIVVILLDDDVCSVGSDCGKGVDGHRLMVQCCQS